MNMSVAELKKADKEKEIFRIFVQKSSLPVDLLSIECKRPPEPDSLCAHATEGKIAFELAELCIEEIAKANSDMIKPGRSGYSCMFVSDPTKDVVRSKLSKSYRTEYPIELLLYTNGRTGSTDEWIILDIRDVVGNIGLGQFRKIWILGKSACEVDFE